jgi:flagellar L-ring protein precursor FlgH
MNHRKALLLVLMACMLIPGSRSLAGSIWAKRDKDMRDFYADDVARNIGDVLTIRISEASKVDNKGKRDLKKESALSTTFNGELGGFADLGEFGTDATSSNELKSKADFKDERSFTDRVTVVVVDILPNRNLVVMGTRDRNIAGDKQTIEISGIVRPSDIAFDNTIKSEQVANFRIVTRNRGVAAPYTKPGWLGRMLNAFWPF